jgi:hypothetical protein
MPYGSLIIKFAADLAEFQRDVKRSTTLVERELKGLQRTAGNFARAFQAALIGTGAVTAVRAIIREASAAEESEKRLAGVIKATGDVSGFTAKQLEAMNRQLVELSRFDDESIREAQAQIIAFGNISGEQFERALKLSADLAELLGEDVTSAAQKLGKALADPTSALEGIARGRIKLTEAQKEQIKELTRLNDLQGAQNVLLTAAESKVGGLANEMNTGLLKEVADLSKAWNDMLEEVAKTGAFRVITDTFRGLTSLIRDIKDELKGIPSTLTTLQEDISNFVLETPLRFTPLAPVAKKMMDAAKIRREAFKIAGGQAPTDEQIEQAREVFRAQEEAASKAGVQDAWAAAGRAHQAGASAAKTQAAEVRDAWVMAGEARVNAAERAAQAAQTAAAAEAKSSAGIQAAVRKADAEFEAQAAAQQRMIDERERLRKDEEARRKREISEATVGARGALEAGRAQAVAQQAKAAAQAEQQLAAQRLDVLERFHEEGLIGEREYWQARADVQRQAFNAELAAQDKQIEAIGREVSSRREAVALASKERETSGKGAVAYLNALKDLDAAQAKQKAALEERNQLEREFGFTSVKNSLDAAVGTRQYEDAVKDLNAQIAELQGRSADAARIRFDQQTRTLRALAEKGSDTATVEKIAQLRRLTEGQASFNDLQKKAQLATRQLAIEEERIRNSREAGAISEFRSLKETSDARARALGELQQLARELEAVAEASEDAFLVQQAQQFTLEIQRLANQTDLLAQKFEQIGESSFADFLTEVLDDINSVEDAFKRMVDSIVRQINRLAAEEISNVLFRAISGGAGEQKGIGAAFGGIISKIFSGDVLKQIASVIKGAGESVGAIEARVKPIWEFEGIEPPTVSVNTQPVWDFAGVEPPKVSIPTEPMFDFADVKIPTISVQTEPVLDFVDMERAIKTISVPVESAGPIQVSTPDELTIPVEGLFKGLTDVPAPTEIPVEGIWKGLTEAVEPIKIPIEGLWKGLASSVEPIDVPINGLFQGLASAAGGAGYYAAADISNLFLQDGGRVKAGHAYVVGDGGEPEWFVPDTAGSVIPFSEMSSGGGRMTVINQFTISGQMDRRSQDQIALAAARGVQRSLDRNG